MKVLFITDVYPPEFETSVGTIVFNLASEMNSRGAEVAVLCATRDKNKAGLQAENGLKVYRVFADFKEKWRAYLGLYNPQVIKAVQKVFADFKPEVVHIHLVHYLLSYHVLKLAKKAGARVVMTAHDVMLFHYGKLTEFIDPGNLSVPATFSYNISGWQLWKRFKKRYNPVRNIMIRHYLKYVDKILAVSESLKNALKQNGLKNVAVVYNGINVDGWHVPQEKVEEFKNQHNLKNKKIVLFGGRLSGLKGSEQLIQALTFVGQKIGNLVLVVVGAEDKYAREIKKMAGRSKIPLVITGWLKDNELKSAYFASDVVVTPSICLDTFNLMNIEAMAAKKPVVGTCFGGTPEVVKDKETGFIINPFNTADFADKLAKLLSDERLAQEMGEAGFKRAEKMFSLDRQVESYLEWYRR